MSFCPRCGREISENYNVCPFCRQVLRADSLLRAVEHTEIKRGSKGKMLIVAAVMLFIGVGLGYASSLPEIQTMQTEATALRSSILELENQVAAITEASLEEASVLQARIEDLEDQLALMEETSQEEVSALQAMIRELETRLASVTETQEVSVLTDQEYYSFVKDAIAEANDTIFVAMYSMIYDYDDSFDWANDLIRELVNAKKRGVDVRVLIEYRTYFDTMTGNFEAYNYLSSNGVSVELDNEDDTDHMKFIVIDGLVVFAGSHNWSESSLYYNHETSVRIVSEDVAELFENYFGEI